MQPRESYTRQRWTREGYVALAQLVLPLLVVGALVWGAIIVDEPFAKARAAHAALAATQQERDRLCSYTPDC